MHAFTELAKKAITEYISNGIVIQVPEGLSSEMKERAGVFVSLKKKGQLRGCIGTFMPVCDNLAEEIIRNAISAATGDPRFSPVMPEEFSELSYSVNVLSPPEKVEDIKALDARRYGVIVVKGGRRGLLLPDLEGVDTVAEQISIAKMKAGISINEKVELYRFEVKRYK